MNKKLILLFCFVFLVGFSGVVDAYYPVYVVWEEGDSHTVDDDGHNGRGHDIFFRMSTNGGASWGSIKNISNTPTPGVYSRRPKVVAQ